MNQERDMPAIRKTENDMEAAYLQETAPYSVHPNGVVAEATPAVKRGHEPHPRHHRQPPQE